MSQVILRKDIHERDQSIGFRNATMQPAGKELSLSIETRLEIPAHIYAAGQDAVASYVESALCTAASGVGNLRFNVQLGKSSDARPY